MNQLLEKQNSFLVFSHLCVCEGSQSCWFTDTEFILRSSCVSSLDLSSEMISSINSQLIGHMVNLAITVNIQEGNATATCGLVTAF